MFEMKFPKSLRIIISDIGVLWTGIFRGSEWCFIEEKIEK
jgi:hypothetical protein